MQKCAYCGHENGDTATMCVECGTSINVPKEFIKETGGLDVQARVVESIWTKFAIQRGRVYLAAFLVCLFSGLIFTVKRGSGFWLIPCFGVLGPAAVWLMKLLGSWQAQLDRDRAQGKNTALKSILFGLGGLIAFILVVGGFTLLVSLGEK